MSIDRLYNPEKRKGVAWFGVVPPPDGELVFKEREFRVTSCSAQELREPAYLAGLAAVIFTQRAGKLQGITQGIEDHAERLLDYDCRIIIRSLDRPDLNGVSVITRVVNKLRLWTDGLPREEAEKLTKWQPADRGVMPLPHARVFGLSAKWTEIANFIMEHQPGPAPDFNVTITPEEERQQLDPGYETLLRRAFWDCTEVHLKRIVAGRSGVSVYCAYAELAEGQLGPWPLPYFVKIGDRSQVFDEYVNYQDRVDPYVPFHLGPHLIPERCCLGAHVGVIVGDFVEESESLAKCARDGRAGPAIACLFNRTLAGWHRGAQQDQLESSQLGKSYLYRFPRMRKAWEPRLARARELGATKNLDELRGLFQRCVSTPVLVGPIHGDLHAGNVQVRATDAILIDFRAHKKNQPLVYDAACLEASLLIDGFDDGTKDVRESMPPEQIQRLDSGIRNWLESIKTLYDHVPLQESLIHPNPKNPSCWFHACVRQIRLYAWQIESGQHQYAAALALALLTRFTKDLKAPEPEASRRAGAYILAERVLLSAFKLKVEDYCI